MAHVVAGQDARAGRPVHRLTLVILGVFLVAGLGLVGWILLVPLTIHRHEQSAAIPPGAVPEGVRWEVEPVGDGSHSPFDASETAQFPTPDRWRVLGGDMSLRAVVAEPGRLALEPERDVSANCVRVLSGFLVKGFVASIMDWRYGRAERTVTANPLHATQSVALGEFQGRVASPTGSLARLRGRVGISESSVLLVAHVEQGGPVSDLELLLPAALIVWPSGLEALGRMEHASRGTGMLWLHGGWNRDSTLNREVSCLWPSHVSSWSDGAWCILGIHIDGKPDMSAAAKPPPPPFLLRANAEPRCFPDRLGRYDLRAVSAAPGGLDYGAAMVNKRRPVNGNDLRMRFLRREEWSSGQVAPVPEEVARRLGLAPGMESLMVDLPSDTVLGNATVGLLDCVDTGPSVRGAVSAPCQWVLGPDYFAITLATTMDPRGSRDPRLPHGPEGWLSRQLPKLLGDDGMRLTAVPVRRRKSTFGEGVLVWPVPDTLVGFPKQYRVSEAPWGRVRVYTDPEFLHAVYDL